ncbi:hypothetical protein [Microvirga zambiensis]|uniref:hypothetical protein n=1 Tax=Microvirga zambiensis TaxID=1402137 RepID=UPI00191F2C2C|nr:hypothetical protein [Microvirga zambiensis]
MSYKATLDSIERKLAKWRERHAPNPFVPQGYCTLETAVNRAAAVFFPQEYGKIEISPQEEERLARHSRAVEDLKRVDMWERDFEKAREHAENAMRASATNMNSFSRRAAGHWPEAPYQVRPMSEGQEKTARLDAIEDDEIQSIQQRIERREMLRDEAWERLRQGLYDGKLAAFSLGNDGGDPLKIKASSWSARWAANAHKQAGLSNPLINEAELATLLSGDEPHAASPLATSSTALTSPMNHRKSNRDRRADSFLRSDSHQPEPTPYRRATKAEVELYYKSWIEQHEGWTPPSRDDDLRHMREHFPTLSRDRIRKLRSDLAPKEWVQRGRRSKTGAKKLAENS